MKSIYVTGAAGWLGRALVNAFQNSLEDYRGEIDFDRFKKSKIYLLVRPEEKKAFRDLPKNFEVRIGDLTNPKSLKNFLSDADKNSTLFHLAGIIHPRLKVAEFYQTNFQGTQNLLREAIKKEVSDAIIVSSNSPIGCNPDRKNAFDENSPYRPYMNYGKSKKQMEEFCLSSEIKDRIRLTLIRTPWFYGPFQPPRQTLFFQMIRDGKMPIVGDGKNLRSMSYIDNLVYGLLLAAEKQNPSGEIFWIADENPYSMNQIVETVENLMEKEFGQKCTRKRMKLPFIAGEFATLCDAIIQGAGLYQSKIHVLSEMNKNIFCSVEKAKTGLGYRPKISLEEGMRRSLQFLADRNHGKLPF